MPVYVVMTGAPLEAKGFVGPFTLKSKAEDWARDFPELYPVVCEVVFPGDYAGGTPSPVEEPAEPTFLFGKYNGQTHASVLKHNPGYIKWAYENVSNHAGISEEMYRRAVGNVPLPFRRTRPPSFDHFHEFADDDIPF